VAFGGAGDSGGLFFGVFLAIGIVLLAVGALAVVLGINILKGRTWARTGTLVIVGIALAITVVYALLPMMLTEADAGTGGILLVGMLPNLVLSSLVVFALMRPESKAFFGVPTPVGRGPAPSA
jgi:hypothetical protein